MNEYGLHIQINSFYAFIYSSIRQGVIMAISVQHPVVNFTKRYCNIVFRDRYILQLLNIEIGLLYFQLSYLQHGTFSVG